MTAYVENPEAVGDPNQTPRVRLWAAGEPVSSERFNKLDADLAAAAARAERAEAAIQRAQPVLDAVAAWRAAELPPDAHNKVYRALNALAIAWDAYAHPEDSTDPVEDAPTTRTVQCSCDDCVEESAGGQLDAPAPTRSGEEKTVGEAVGDAIRKAMPSARSDSRLPVDGEEKP